MAKRRPNPLKQNAVAMGSEFWLDVAEGNIPGLKGYNIPGRRDGLSQSALDDISQVPSGTVLPVPGGIQMEVVSSSGEDSATGTGIRTLDLHYLDIFGEEQEETIILAGATPVNTVATNIDQVQWMHALTVGSSTVAVGNVDLRNTAGSTTYERIAATGNQSLSARYTVPVGKIGYVLGWEASAITKIIDSRLRATVERFDRSLVPGVFLFQDAIVLDACASPWVPFRPPLKMPAGATIKVSGISSASGGDGGTMFSILLVDQ